MWFWTLTKYPWVFHYLQLMHIKGHDKPMLCHIAVLLLYNDLISIDQGYLFFQYTYSKNYYYPLPLWKSVHLEVLSNCLPYHGCHGLIVPSSLHYSRHISAVHKLQHFFVCCQLSSFNGLSLWPVSVIACSHGRSLRLSSLNSHLSIIWA